MSKTEEEAKPTRNPKASGGASAAVEDYMVAHVREPDVCRRLRAHTLEKLGSRAVMQITADQGQFFTWLLQTLGAKTCVEVGVFTGYSSLCTALALPEDGKLYALDISEEYTELAKPFWKEAGVDSKIDLRIKPAVESLDELIDAGLAGTVDFAFIDADKTGYDAYYERLLKLLRVGGVIAIDNVLWHGKCADPSVTDDDTLALRALNDKILADERVAMSMTVIGDGVTFVRKL